MQLYHYDKTTKEYIDVTTATANPLVAGEFLKPAHCTEIANPSVGIYQTSLFTGTGWRIVSDYRDIPIWNKSTAARVDFLVLGQPLPTAYTMIDPGSLTFPKWDGIKWIQDVVQELESEKGHKYADLVQGHKEAEAVSTATNSGVTYAATRKELEHIAAEHEVVIDIHHDTDMVIYDVEFLPHTLPASDADQLINDIHAKVAANLDHLKQKQHQVLIATTVADVKAITY